MYEGEARPIVEIDDGLEKPMDECGVFGIYAPGEPVATITYLGLQELQHRGQSGAGIFVYDENLGLIGHKGTGLIDAAIPEAVPTLAGESILDTMSGSSVAIGHTRYSTSESNHVDAAQPFKGDRSGIAVSQNGHTEGIGSLAEAYDIDPSEGVSDTHVLTLILDKRAAELGSLEKALAEVLPQVDGAYSLTITDGKRLIGVRDPWGFHPLVLGRMPGGGHVLASEPAALAAAHAEFVRDITPGEVVTIGEDGVDSFMLSRREPRRECMYEYIYMARPENTINGVSVYAARKQFGRYLAEDNPVDADVVVGVPSSGMAAAAGFAEASGIPQVEGLFKNPYVARSFLERGANRETVLRRKLRPNVEEIAGRRIVLVDDSLIKGNTMRALIGMLRAAGAAEVHVRLSAPQYMYPCYMGMDTGNPNELLARTHSLEEICQEIGADSVGFNTVERMEQAIGDVAKGVAASQAGRLCTACATGEYPFETGTFLGIPTVRTPVGV